MVVCCRGGVMHLPMYAVTVCLLPVGVHVLSTRYAYLLLLMVFVRTNMKEVVRHHGLKYFVLLRVNV